MDHFDPAETAGGTATAIPPPPLRTRAERDKLALDNVRLIGFVIGRLGMSRRRDREDLQQVGMVALLRAAETWRADGGASYCTWGFHAVRMAILQHVAREGWARLPSRLRGGQVGEAIRDTTPGRLPPEALVAALRVDDPDDLGEADEARGRAEAVERALRLLRPREANVVRRRLLLGHPTADVAADLGVSRARVQQILQRSLEALRGRCPWLARWLG